MTPTDTVAAGRHTWPRWHQSDDKLSDKTWCIFDIFDQVAQKRFLGHLRGFYGLLSCAGVMCKLSFDHFLILFGSNCRLQYADDSIRANAEDCGSRRHGGGR